MAETKRLRAVKDELTLIEADRTGDRHSMLLALRTRLCKALDDDASITPRELNDMSRLLLKVQDHLARYEYD
jgi:hypothetical protein